MKSQTSNQIEESIYQYLLEKEVFFWLCSARKNIIALLIFFFFHLHILFGLKPKEEIESEWEDNQGLSSTGWL